MALKSAMEQMSNKRGVQDKQKYRLFHFSPYHVISKFNPLIVYVLSRSKLSSYLIIEQISFETYEFYNIRISFPN